MRIFFIDDAVNGQRPAASMTHLLGVVVGLGLVMAPGAWAFSLTPMSVSIEVGQKTASQAFVIDNNSPERIAVQVSMAGRKVDTSGVETNPEADDDFIVYPPQLVLEPNEKRTVRVSWAGDPKPSRELAYRIIAEQLPVDTSKPDKKKNVLIKMLLRYMGAVYITPRGAEAKIELQKVAPIVSKKGVFLGVDLANKGTAHQIVKSAVLKLKAGAKSLELGDGDLKPLIGQNILAGGFRHFEVPWPKDLSKEATLSGAIETSQ